MAIDDKKYSEFVLSVQKHVNKLLVNGCSEWIKAHRENITEFDDSHLTDFYLKMMIWEIVQARIESFNLSLEESASLMMLDLNEFFTLKTGKGLFPTDGIETVGTRSVNEVDDLPPINVKMNSKAN